MLLLKEKVISNRNIIFFLTSTNSVYTVIANTYISVIYL